jgi:hypothetical protein
MSFCPVAPPHVLLQRFTQSLAAAQAARDDFVAVHAAQLPPGLTETLPVRPLSVRACIASLQVQKPPSFALSIQGLGPELCAKLN